MKTLLIAIAIFCAIPALSQQLLAGGGAGHYNQGASAQLKTTYIHRTGITAIAAVSFSQRVPFQNELRLGYAFGNRLQVIPSVGAAYYQYASTDKHKNYFKPAAGLQVQYNINEYCAVYASRDTRFTGAGFLINLIAR